VIGSLQGEIRIFEIEIDPEYELLSEKEKLVKRKEPKLIDSFNFFTRNLKPAKSFMSQPLDEFIMS
jgi:hypothetical protein